MYICNLFKNSNKTKTKLKLILQKYREKMLNDLETIIAAYLRPVNLQLEDIYRRLSTLEKKLNQ